MKMSTRKTIKEQDWDLRKKIEDVTRQHKIDLFFEDEIVRQDFFEGLDPKANPRFEEYNPFSKVHPAIQGQKYLLLKRFINQYYGS